MMSEAKTCHICKGDQLKGIVERERAMSIYSDANIRLSTMNKCICEDCGLVQVADEPNRNEVEAFYEEEYELNVRDEEKHCYLRGGESIPRSRVIYETWIKDLIDWGNVKNILEIGCGEGALLHEILRHHPIVELAGMEKSTRACEIAKRGILDINQGVLDADVENQKQYDAVIAVGVIEHVLDPTSFMTGMRRLTTESGTVLIACPDATTLSYDIFFADHLYHFTPDHICGLMKANEIQPVDMIRDHSKLPNFMCIKGVKRSADSGGAAIESGDYRISRCRESVSYYERAFSFIDKELGMRPGRKWIAYGSNEIFALFVAHTDISKHLICVFDDRPVSSMRCGIPVRRPEEWNIDDADDVILTLNIEYHSAVSNKLKALGFKGRLLNPFQQEIIKFH